MKAALAMIFVVACSGVEPTGSAAQETGGICTLPKATGDCDYQQEAADATYVAESSYSADASSLSVVCWHATGRAPEPDGIVCLVSGFYWWDLSLNWGPVTLRCNRYDWVNIDFADGCLLQF